MTPKEKAKELFNRLLSVEYRLSKYPMCFDTAKQCALLCVEQQKELLANIKTEDCWEWEDYYEEVKQEIEKI